MKHFISHTQPSTENSIHIILDIHLSHIRHMEEEWNNSHCSHRLQHLNISIAHSFKAHCEMGIRFWFKSS
jgi:isopentenyldiphosphate isomerase